MKTLIYISLRYLLSGKGSTKLVSFIALLGVSLSVTALLLTMGVFAGFQQALREKILSSSPHVIVSFLSSEKASEYSDTFKEVRGVRDYYSVTLYQGLISKGGRVMSVSVKAMSREDIKRVYGVDLREGVVVGAGLADVLGLKEGDELLLISPMGRKTPFGFLPAVRRVILDGTFERGVFDQDYATLLIDIESAREFFGEDYQLMGYEVYVDDPYRAQEVKESIEKLVSRFALVRSWIDLNKPLFNALQLEKVGISFVLMLMVLIASFNITSLLFMKAKEKIRDIAVLRTFGLRREQVAALFILQGTIIGVVGTLLGFVIALLGGYLINEYRLVRVPADVYLMDHVPVYFELGDILFTLSGAIVLSLLSSLLPALRASRENIVQVLRNE